LRRAAPSGRLRGVSERLQHFEADPYRDTDGILRVVREGLCHRCGACVGFCPVGTYATKAGYPDPVNDCIHCNICVGVCSGLAVDYPAIGKALLGPDYAFGGLLGTTRGAWLAHASDPDIRSRGASGGVVTAILVHWLKTGFIKGALVTVGDPDEPSMGRGIIARTPEDVLRAAQSRYTTAPSLAALLEIRDEDGPFAAVGLPCQIHALRKRQLVDPRWARRVPYTIGLFCHYNLPWETTKLTGAMLAPRGEKVTHVRFRQRDERGWPASTYEFTFSGGSTWRSPHASSPTFNVLSRVSPLGRCLMCMDGAAEFSDFAIGDPWIRGKDGEWKYHSVEGDSTIVPHTEQGARLVDALRSADALDLRPLPVAEIAEGQHAMLTEKKARVAFRLRVRRRLGLPVPRYPMPLPATTAKQRRKDILFLLTRLNSFSRAWQQLLLRIGLGPIGVFLVNRRIAKRKRLAAQGKVHLSASDYGDATEK